MKHRRVVTIWTQTIDGYIAKSGDDDLSWGARVDKQWFSKVTREIGVIVMGRKTFELIGKPLPGRLNVVMTRKLVLSTKHPRQEAGTQVLSIDKNNLEFTSRKPKEILRDLQKKGFKQVAICGGASIYTLWLKEKLVDEVWVSVQPLVFGEGIKSVAWLEEKLTLISYEEIGEGVIVLKYKVVR
ncbi:MAG: dihydrofolate reductase [Candidatus Chisholmbacteria bacterium]|nr:dihydrofolate reductase [Candidatus Chisholmbacteria bacterium]